MDGHSEGEGAGLPLNQPEAGGRVFPEQTGGVFEPRPDGGAPTLPRRRRLETLASETPQVLTYLAAPRRAWQKRGPSWRRRLILLALVFVVLLAIAIPGVVAAVSGLRDYDEIKTIGLTGVHHLLNAKDILAGNTITTGSETNSCETPTPAGTPTTGTSSGLSLSSFLSGDLPDAATVKKAQVELIAAEASFQQLQSRLNHPDWVLSIAASVPDVSGKMTTARGLANAGYDISAMGVELSNAALPLLTRLHGANLGGQSLLTQADVTSLQKAMDDAVILLADIRVQTAFVNVGDLPICAAQKTEYTKLIAELPKAQDYLQQADGLIQPVGWLLGVDGPRHFLMQELDNTELRATGGFSGQFGILTVQDGKLAPFSLLAVDCLDYNTAGACALSNGWTNGRRPPAAYSWWPIANWGLRDANLNGDFPTDAKLVMSVFKSEATDSYFKNQGGGNVDGVVQFTPTAIAHVLDVTGPLTVPLYDVAVTGANLTQLIHFYQLDPTGKLKNQEICLDQGGTKKDCGVDNNIVRHQFARTLTTALEARLRGLSLKQLVPVAKQAFKDMQAHDIQFYVTNKQLEDLLLKHSAGGAISFPTGVDGFMVDSTQWSAGKINDHISSVEQDDVTLDDKGGATHNLTISVTNYNANIIPRDFAHYWDYIRIYAPKQAQLISAYGFQSNTQLCVGSKCPDNPYPGALVCPVGSFKALYSWSRTNTLLGGEGDPPLMKLGGPTSTTSDVAGLTMWGGNFVVPLGCTATLSLSWYMPGVAPTSKTTVAASVVPYTDLVQRQGGTEYQAKVTLHPAPHVAAEGKKTVTYTAALSTDLRFTFSAAPQTPSP